MRLTSILCVSLFAIACDRAVETDDHGHREVPDKDTGEPGPFPLPTMTGYFLEEKGIEEEIPECHPFYGNDKTCAAASHMPAGDIWEQCDANGYLIETGPAAHAADFPCHNHANGIGHPIRIDCAEYCENIYGDPTEEPTYTGWCATKKLTCGGAMRDVGYCECEPIVATPCPTGTSAAECKDAPLPL